MGQNDYVAFWNACESAADLVAPNSQYNLDNAVVTEAAGSRDPPAPEEQQPKLVHPVFDTLTTLLQPVEQTTPFEKEVRKKRRRQTLSRRGYVLRAPCEDVLGFLRLYAPASQAERAVLDYLYATHAPHDFVRRTQVMNEGWAMFWEKRIMTELFRERAVKGIIEYARVFSGVCYPRPYFQRNPYHLGYNLWCHIEGLYRDGKVSLAFLEETDQEKKEAWKVDTGADPIGAMEHLVRTITDYEFLRRFLTPGLVHEFHLNRVDRRLVERLGLKDSDVVDADERWVWLDPEPIRDEMLRVYAHFYRPRIYVVDPDYRDGGLLLYHRDDGRGLKKAWIRPTLRNLNAVWKAPVALLSKETLYSFAGDQYREEEAESLPFEQILELMGRGEKPYRAA